MSRYYKQRQEEKKFKAVMGLVLIPPVMLAYYLTIGSFKNFIPLAVKLEVCSITLAVIGYFLYRKITNAKTNNPGIAPASTPAVQPGLRELDAAAAASRAARSKELRGETAAPTLDSATRFNIPTSHDVLPTQMASPRFDLSAIDWYQFEKVVAKLLRLEGWTVHHKGGAKADGGVDIIASRPEERILVQCKHWFSWDIQAKTLRELHGARFSAEFASPNTRAVVFTTTEPTKPALQFAQANGITVITSPELIQRLSAFAISEFPEFILPEHKFCPKCDAPMVLRGSFWGCSNYGRLKCRGQIKIIA